ncbi:MAG: pectinesterase family protein [Polyangiaceae bacterium]
MKARADSIAAGGAIANGGFISGGTSNVARGGNDSIAGASTGGALGGSGTGGNGNGGAVTSGGGAAGGSATGGASGSTGQGGNSAGAGNGGVSAQGGSMGFGGESSGGTSGGASQGGSVSKGGASSGGSGSGGTTATSGGVSSSGGTTSTDAALCPPGITKTITVAKDGSGQFTKVQAAIDSIASGSSARIRINVKSGTYYEQIKVEGRTNLCLVGAGATNTILTFDDSAAKAQTRTGSTVNGYSFTVNANDFSAANIAFENTCITCGQATALGLTALRNQFLNVRVLGMQDTLYLKKGSQYFRNSYAEGNVDFVFGASVALLENCELHSRVGGVLVAPNTDISSPYGFVIRGGKLTAPSTLGAKSVALGRPWEQNGAAVFLKVDMGAHISAAGFIPMGDAVPEKARFGEYLSTGPGGDSSARTRYQISASQAALYTLSNLFGAWVPSYSQ